MIYEPKNKESTGVEKETGWVQIGKYYCDPAKNVIFFVEGKLFS